MVWVMLDDKFHGHRKTLALFDGPCAADAIALWTLGASWCGDQLSDGFLPTSFVKRSGFDKRAAAELVRVELWHVVEGGYQFHDWLHRNRSKQEVTEERLRKSEAGKAGARARWQVPLESHSGPHHVRNATAPEPPMLPTRTYPVPEPIPIPTPDSERAMASFNSTDLTALFSTMRKAAGGGFYEQKRSDYDALQAAVAWARLEREDDPMGACADSIGRYLEERGTWCSGWPLSIWAKDPGRWLARASDTQRPVDNFSGSYDDSKNPDFAREA